QSLLLIPVKLGLCLLGYSLNQHLNSPLDPSDGMLNFILLLYTCLGIQFKFFDQPLNYGGVTETGDYLRLSLHVCRQEWLILPPGDNEVVIKVLLCDIQDLG